ncbi:ArsR/SmtB family transcription factor [Virgisporangium aurantiacum]|uniref:Transcriptional regulator n=1 Tax=Virgisporangium aurantiacum TaxID=175570 RepID=A0A8J4E4N2_9ACTN|nr:metalloregulator ArsR/SmtB family transcription factor [Virgisporangium aurantiacum]GIJ61228.1 transcriptional regulator [Virgisporangium aurantiacum]
MGNEPVLTRATQVARELADPLRLLVLQTLASEGPHTASRLAETLRVTGPRLGNHLARLRDAGLVDVEHTGRHAVYRLADADLGDVLTALLCYAGSDSGQESPRPPRDIVRTCYDHTAGLLGVRLFAWLVDRGALRAPDGRTDEVTLGRDPAALTEIGVDPSAITAGRRRLAVACLDRTHLLPHLGGELGRVILDTLIRDDVLRRGRGDRVLTVTPAGAGFLTALLPGLDLDVT